MAEKFKEICDNIKACLISTKRRVSLKELNRDYHSILGESIPFKTLGYSSLEKLIRAVPDLIITHVGSELYVDAKPDPSTMHITNLVRGQKSGKKKPSKAPYYGKSGYWKPPTSKRATTPPQPRMKGGSLSNALNPPNSAPYPPKKQYSPQIDKKEKIQHNPTNYEKYRNHKPVRNLAPCPLNFSDSEEQDSSDKLRYDRNNSPEFIESRTLPKPDYNRNLQVTSGTNRKVTVSRPSSRNVSSNFSRNNSIDEDVGYASMNENPAQSNDFAKFPSDTEIIVSGMRKMSLKNTPAAMVAAGRALIEQPNIKEIDTQISYHIPVISSSPMNNNFRQPFKSTNEIPVLPVAAQLPVDVDTLNKNSQPLQVSPPASPMHDKPIPKPAHSSKMCDANMFTPGPHTEPDYSKDTFCFQLLTFTKLKNLPLPVFKNFSKPNLRMKTRTFMSRVKIDNILNMSSCPFESSNLKDVQESVAKSALEVLRQRYEKTDSNILPTTLDERIVISRVAEIVNPHTTGLKYSYVESQYKEIYREKLPFNWLDVIKQMTLLSVEELLGGTVVYPALVEGFYSISSITSLPQLILPLHDVWNVYITSVAATNKVYFRILADEYNGLYEKMVDTMEKIYSTENNEKKPVDIVKEGNFYAAFIEESWFRIKTLRPEINGSVNVLLIDHGEIDTVAKELIYPLDEQLIKLPAQAVRCQLTKLDQYCNELYVTEIVHNLIYGEAMVAKINSRNPRLQLTLHDTRTEDDINVNEQILNKIEKELTPPKIPTKGSFKPVHLTSVLGDGQAFVQLISDSLVQLRDLLEEANEELKKNEDEYIVKEAKELVGSKIFLVKYLEDERWHRATINNLVASSNEAEITYIDYGNSESVPFNQIVDAQRLSLMLCVIPPQAICVELMKPTDDIFTEKIIDFLMNLTLPKTPNEPPETFLMKVVEDRNLPYVELFVRLSAEGELLSINNIIGSCFVEYRGKDFKSVKISKELASKFRPIPLYELTPQLVEFEVYVHMVSNPNEFFIHPQDSRYKLQDLMTLMNEFYEKQKPTINIEELIIGEAYAVKDVNGMWCRGICLQVFESMNSLSLKLVDFGSIVSVKYRDIAHLLPCFRELPCLGIKAEVAGIEPKNMDWDIGDCVRFKNLVYGKVLTSFVVEARDDKVALVLYDKQLREGNAIDIGAQLVEEGIALDITQKN